MALIGAAIDKNTSLTKAIDTALPKRHGTPTSDMIKTYLGLLSQGKNDYEAINNVRNDGFFRQALGLQKAVPTEANIRIRLENEADELLPIINQANVEFLSSKGVPVTPLYTGHIPLDIDVTPHDNSKTKKEQVSRTYKGMDGYAPIACYLGQEGGRAFDMSCVQENSTVNATLFRLWSVPSVPYTKSWKNNHWPINPFWYGSIAVTMPKIRAPSFMT